MSDPARAVFSPSGLGISGASARGDALSCENVMGVLALWAVWLSGAVMWFFWFWPGFSYWRRHRTLTYSLLLGFLVVVTLVVYWLRGPLLAERLPFPLWVHVLGWMLIAVASVLGFVADRQIGLRVRSFAPFFEPHGRIALKTTGAYGIVRHPIYAAGIGFQLGLFLATGYLVLIFAAVVLALSALWFTRQEERHLQRLLDDPQEYERYRARVPALCPRFGRQR